MKIMYKCGCMAAETEIEVTDRRPNGDILPWMEMVQHAISVDHAALSPMCRRGALEYAKIPLEGDQIGTPPTKQ